MEWPWEIFLITHVPNKTTGAQKTCRAQGQGACRAKEESLGVHPF